jgi:hypothetical protein
VVEAKPPVVLGEELEGHGALLWGNQGQRKAMLGRVIWGRCRAATA